MSTFKMVEPFSRQTFFMDSNYWTGETKDGQPVQYINGKLFYCMNIVG